MRPERGNLIGPDPRAHLGHIDGAREGWKPSRLAAGPKDSSALCDSHMKDFVLAMDLVSSQEGILSCPLHQKVQYSGFVEWETCCQSWQAEPCVVWSDDAHCFGTSFIFHIQMVNATMIPPQTKAFPKLCLREQQPPYRTEKP